MNYHRSRSLSRRSLLKGAALGGVVSLGLPWLEYMVGTSSALADAARTPPLRFGTWFWGCGVTPGLWLPEISEDGFTLKQESAPLEGVKQHLNILTGFDAILDGKPNHVHVSGTYSIRSGIAPTVIGKIEGPTFETAIADHLSTRTRFRTLDVTATGNPRDSYSYSSTQVRNTPETKPIDLYNRIYGEGFRDPNEAFTPDPTTLPRLSVLSAVRDQRKALETRLGAEDRHRLDQYFTSVRQVEQQLELQMEPPTAAGSCTRPDAPDESETNYSLDNVHRNHEVMARLLALAMTCDQTRSFNVLFSNSASSLHRPGEASSHHLYTHEEITDADVGYQIETSKFVVENMKGWATFVDVLASTPEADGTLLDSCLVFAHSDTSWAKIHAVQDIPMLTAGRAGGRIKTGLHINANGDPISRVGLTMQQIAGLPVESWGAGSMATDDPVTQIMV